MAAIGTEVFASALIALGLMTRPAAFLLGFAMCVAAFQVHGAGAWFLPAPGAKEPALIYLLFCFVLIITGGGQWSALRDIALDKPDDGTKMMRLTTLHGRALASY